MSADVDCEVAGVVDKYTVFEGQVDTVDVKVDYMCPKQHVVQNVNLETAITRFLMRIQAMWGTLQNCFSCLRAKVTVEDAECKMIDFVVDDFVLCQLLKLGCESFFETDVLVGKLLVEE